MARVIGWDEFGSFNEKRLSEITDDLIIYMRMTHGPDIGLEPGDVDRQLIEAVAPEYRMLWAAVKGSVLQAFIRTAVGTALDEAVEALRMKRQQAKKATGDVTFSRTTAAPAGGVTIPAGTIVATEDDIRFTTDAEATIAEGQTSVTTAVTATSTGASGNVSSSTVTTLVSTVTGVDSVTNSSAMTGGADKESDDSLRARALNHPAVRGKATVNAIRSQLLDADIGVDAAQVLVNNDPDTTADDTFINSTETGTASETIDTTTNRKIAQKFVVPSGGKWVQDVRFKVFGGTSPVAKVRIETDTSGSPSGTLAHANLEKTGVSLTTNAENDIHFAQPAYLAAGTYWLVIEATSGSFTLDGGTGGTADQVEFYNGSVWAASANIENGNVDIIAGMPPHSVHPYVRGGAAADIGKQLLDVVAAGIRTWGDQTATVTDDGGNSHTIRFSRPTTVTIYVDVTLTKDADEWDATNGPDAVRDAIVKYIGGTDTEGTVHPGLDLGEDVLRVQLIKAITGVAGVLNITTLKIDKVDPPVATTGDITITATELARSQTAADIGVTVS